MLDRYGNPTAPFIWAPKLIVDLGPGDEIRHNGSRYKVAGVRPWLEHGNMSAEFLCERSIENGIVQPETTAHPRGTYRLPID